MSQGCSIKINGNRFLLTRLNPQSEVAPSGQIIRLKPYKNSWWRYLRFEKVITSDRIMSMISNSRSDRIESVTKVTPTVYPNYYRHLRILLRKWNLRRKASQALIGKKSQESTSRISGEQSESQEKSILRRNQRERSFLWPLTGRMTSCNSKFWIFENS